MRITQRAEDVYEVSTCGGLCRLVVTGARLVVQRTGRVGYFVQRLVGYLDATRTRFEATIRRLTDREAQRLLPGVPVELGVAERLLGQAMRRLGMRQVLGLLVALATEPAGLPAGG